MDGHREIADSYWRAQLTPAGSRSTETLSTARLGKPLRSQMSGLPGSGGLEYGDVERLLAKLKVSLVHDRTSRQDKLVVFTFNHRWWRQFRGRRHQRLDRTRSQIGELADGIADLIVGQF